MTLLVRLSMKHTVPWVLSHPAQFPKVPLVAAAVRVTEVPVGKLPEQLEPLLREQPSPAGELETVPAPAPDESIVTVGPVPVKQVTVAVIDPVTTAPDEDTPDPSELVVVSAVIRTFGPQTTPVAVISPVEFTVTS